MKFTGRMIFAPAGTWGIDALQRAKGLTGRRVGWQGGQWGEAMPGRGYFAYFYRDGP